MPAPDPSTFAASLLETKFFAPSRREGLIDRQRLIDRLNRKPAPRLTLISAPPGFGKSTLVAQWISQLDDDVAVAWVSLDERDNQPETFWLYVVAALERAAPGVAGAALSSLQGGQPPPIRSLLTPLLNELARREGRLVLVLDDFHVIEDAQINDDFRFFVEHGPPNMALAIVSRTDPALPLARMRARGELMEVRATDLRLTPQETGAFLERSMGIQLGSEQVAALESRTEGWVAALQLAGLSLQGRADPAEFVQRFSGDDRYVVDYLVDEVLRGLEPTVREFLLRTSILERLAAPLCEAVIGEGDARAMLELLERRNLFLVPLDDRRQWYRYHHLFADVLRAHLFEQYAGEVDVLHRRASDWYAANGEPDAAIQHAIAGRDFAGAARLIESRAETVVTRHHPDQLIAWLQQVPDEVIARLPLLSTFYGHALQGMGDIEGSARWLHIAEAAYASTGESDGERPPVPALLALGRGYLSMVSGDGPATVEHANRALSQLSKAEPHWYGTAVGLLSLAHWSNGDLDAAQSLRAESVGIFERAGDDGLAITSAYHDAELLKARGCLREAVQRYESTFRYLASRGGAALRGAANPYIGLSDVLCERNDLDGAAAALADAERVGIYPPRTPYRHLLARARLLQCRGQLDDALELLDAAEPIGVRGAVPDVRPLAAWRTRLWIAQGRLAEAEEWVRKRGLSISDKLTYRLEYEHITLARLLLARATADDRAAAVGLLERLLASAEAGGRRGTALEIRTLLATAIHDDGRSDDAFAVLEPALIAAEPEGYCRLFIDEGESVAALLRLGAKSGKAAGYCKQLLAAMDGQPAMRVARPDVEALSERETQVLRLLGGDMTGPEIAGVLFVSLNTLRTHTKNIYAKLGVTTRRAAVRRAAELGLLR